ncbi:MAG TPA: hypothetical protein VMT86_02235 [Bryobacteraceae bacterium]|nr:hypothetical protein [Bryobacteraceae bacterium]
MCDYSLMSFPNRLAKEGEDLVTYRFASGAMGLACCSDLLSIRRQETARTFWSVLKKMLAAPERTSVPAVCIPPGATLRLMDIPASLQSQGGVGPVEEVTFAQTTAVVNAYRDAIRFRNGREFLIQQLREGQRVRVLTIEPASEPEGIVDLLSIPIGV